MTAWYGYGVTTLDRVDGLAGLEGQPVTLLGQGPLRLVASPAPEVVRDLERADPQQILDAVTRHDQVLVALVQLGSVLPIRFGTVLPDDRAVTDLLADEDGTLAAAFARVADAEEWVVAVTARVDAPAEAPADDAHTPGHAFFARRQSAARQRDRRRVEVVEAARAFDEQVATLARDAHPLELQDAEMVARGAYLVPRDVREAFLRHVDGLAAGEIDVEGPLPPYRFAGPAA